MHVALALTLVAGGTALGADRRTPVVIAVERATPAVVTIETEVAQSSPFSAFYGPQVAQSAGSGVIIDPDGIVLTNAHVVGGAISITVHTNDDRTWPADVVAMDGDLDLAVLQLEGAALLPTIPIGDSDALLLGETVLAIGNPYGLGLTVSTGVIGSVRRDVEIRSGLFQSYIQTDAAINPGNSGGALVDINGNLIGINTAIRADAEGIGFAIPVNRARKIASDMLAFGTVRAPWLGLDLVDVNPRRLAGTPLEKGAVRVARTWRGGPADKAGIRTGDLVFRVDGRAVASRADLNAQLAERTPGARVEIALLRERTVLEVDLVSADAPADLGRVAVRDVLGVTLTPAPQGLQVAAATPSGTWAQANLRVGDLIVAADGQRLSSLRQLEEAIQRAKARHRGSVLFTVRRGRYQGTLEVGV